jgi:hypothetical protein
MMTPREFVKQWIDYNGLPIETISTLLESRIVDIVSDYHEQQVKKFDLADVMGWISVKQELPERGQECWVYTKEGLIEMDLFDGEWWLDQTNSVTHWMIIQTPSCP